MRDDGRADRRDPQAAQEVIETVRSVLAQPSRPAARVARRDALVAGAAGRLGEALLSEVVASSRYRSVTVLTTGPLGSTVGGLRGVPLAALQPADEPLPRHPAAGDDLDVFVCWSDAEDPLKRAHNRRDGIYLEIGTPDELRAVAAAAAGLRARRLMLVAPLRAWQQVSAAARMLPQALEMELARLAIPIVIILRPTTEAGVTAAGGSRLQRFARFYLSQLRFMLPAMTQSLRSGDIAKAALALMASADTPGLTVVPLEEIRQHAERLRGRPAAGQRNHEEKG